jgi:hypothetical protein
VRVDATSDGELTFAVAEPVSAAPM